MAAMKNMCKRWEARRCGVKSRLPGRSGLRSKPCSPSRAPQPSRPSNVGGGAGSGKRHRCGGAAQQECLREVAQAARRGRGRDCVARSRCRGIDRATRTIRHDAAGRHPDRRRACATPKTGKTARVLCNLGPAVGRNRRPRNRGKEGSSMSRKRPDDNLKQTNTGSGRARSRAFALNASCAAERRERDRNWDTSREAERAILVAVIGSGTTRAQAIRHLDELALLTSTAGAEPVARLTQSASSPISARSSAKARSRNCSSCARITTPISSCSTTRWRRRKPAISRK